MVRSILDDSRTRAGYNRNRKACTAALRSFHGRVRTLLAREGLRPTIAHRVKDFDSYIEKPALRSTRHSP